MLSGYAGYYGSLRTTTPDMKAKRASRRHYEDIKIGDSSYETSLPLDYSRSVANRQKKHEFPHLTKYENKQRISSDIYHINIIIIAAVSFR